MAASTLTNTILRKHFRPEDHPYRIYEREIRRHLRSGDTVLDAGCGRRAPVLATLKGSARRLIGMDLIAARPEDLDPAIEYVTGDIGGMERVASGSCDLVISRAVLEHVQEPRAVFAEIRRVLAPGGRFITLVPNLGDYVSLLGKIIPNRLHPWIVRLTEGRPCEDTFPAYYRANTRGAIKRLCRDTGLELESLEYLGQYPASFVFNPALFYVFTGYEKLIAKIDVLRFLRGWLLVVIRKP